MYIYIIPLIILIGKRGYNQKSVREKGTLFHLRNLIKHTVPRIKPEKNMKATEDFYTIVLQAHILSASHTLLSNSTDLHTTISLAKAIVDALTLRKKILSQKMVFTSMLVKC